MGIRGGSNIAMKVPTAEFDAVVGAYRTLGLPVLHASNDMVSFQFGAIQLHIDRRDHFSQAELWLELTTDDLDDAARVTEESGFARCDEIEELAGYNGFWIKSPASIVHLVSLSSDESPS